MPISKLTNGIPSNHKIDQFEPPYGYLSSLDPVPSFDEDVINFSANQRTQKSSNLICKLVLVGDVAVGKSSLATRLCHKTFDQNYKATIGVDFEVERFLVMGVPLSLQIWDTAGQERFKCIAAAYYRGAHVIVSVFDMSDVDTLKRAESWINEALQITTSDNPLIFLVGSKRDLISDNKVHAKIEQAARVVAKRVNAEFWSVSSLTGLNVEELFRRIVCVTYQVLARQQFNLPITSAEKSISKTQLGISLNSANNYPTKQSSKDNCCNAV